MKPLPVIILIVLLVGGIEAGASWWMHPPVAGLGEPVLIYRPSLDFQRHPDGGESPSETIIPTGEVENGLETATAPVVTPLPEIVAKSMPTLRCSTGTASRIEQSDGTTIHLAFFEWNLSDSTNVLEAFKHLPDECMGSIGMKLTEYGPPRSYPVGNELLWFDHTVFRDQAGVIIHAFKGTWVSGANKLTGNGFRGGADQWRQIRWKAAFKRFHPAYARVAQGAVRGIGNPEVAWELFVKSMLINLQMKS